MDFSSFIFQILKILLTTSCSYTKSFTSTLNLYFNHLSSKSTMFMYNLPKIKMKDIIKVLQVSFFYFYPLSFKNIFIFGLIHFKIQTEGSLNSFLTKIIFNLLGSSFLIFRRVYQKHFY